MFIKNDGGEILINEEVSRQVIAMVERGNIRTAKMVIDLMKKMLNMAAKKGKSLKEYIKESTTKFFSLSSPMKSRIICNNENKRMEDSVELIKKCIILK